MTRSGWVSYLETWSYLAGIEILESRLERQAGLYFGGLWVYGHDVRWVGTLVGVACFECVRDGQAEDWSFKHIAVEEQCVKIPLTSARPTHLRIILLHRLLASSLSSASRSTFHVLLWACAARFDARCVSGGESKDRRSDETCID